MDVNAKATTPVLRFSGQRLTSRLIKASLCCVIGWFAYLIANDMASSRHSLQQSSIQTIAFLALALTVAAFVAMRQQADLVRQTEDQSRCRSSEMERLALLGAIHETSDAVVIADAQGLIRYVNPAFTRMTGYDAEEVLGQNPTRSTFGLDASVHKHVRETVVTGNTWHGQAVNYRKDGAAYTEEITVMPARDSDGAIRSYIAVRRDIAARHARAAEALLKSLLETSEDAILTTTATGMIASWNPAAEFLYGYTAAEVAGRPLSMLAPEAQLPNLQSIAETLQRGQSIGPLETVALTKSGAELHISISARPIRDEFGNITGNAAIVRDITSRVEAQEARALLSSLVDSAEDAIFGAAPDGAILSWNQGAQAMYGYAAQDVLNKSFSILFPVDRLSDFSQALQRVTAGETLRQWESITLHQQGHHVEVSLNISPVRDARGTLVGLSAVARDISRRRRDREALRQSEERYRSLVANLPDIVWVANESGSPVFASANCHAVTGYTLDEICRPDFWSTHVHPDDLPRLAAANDALFQKGDPMDVEYRFQRRDGAWIWLHSRAVHTYERDGLRYRDGLISDITERKTMQHKLAYQATHDVLTGLPNRAAFEDRFQQALARARRRGNLAALLHLDIDRFKRINDTLGHSAGDALIQLAAQRLAACLRSSETIARTGGDRFVAVLSDLHDAHESVKVAERILSALAPPFSVKGSEVFLTAKIGIALYPRDGDDPVTLQQAADSALYVAKHHSKQRIQMATTELNQAANRRLAIETELHYALDRDELTLHYQPQFDLATNHIDAVEALVRWHSPKLGHVTPSVLIPVAEESGLIVPLGARVLREACRQAKRWCDDGYEPLQVAVNTSAVQFARGDLAATVSAVLSETGLDAACLDIEVTESVIMHDIRETARQLHELKDLGVSVSLDDFGTGYSSLSYLEELPIDNLKIDRKFIQRMNGVDNTRTLVESIVGLAHGLGMRAVAEGVETAEQLAQLRAMGCDRAQSFMLAGPAPAVSIQALLAQRFTPRAVA
jgi:diguanylate cyclase (GGDEF)-like protein/PAS domain S-box-containing protein